MTTTPDTQAPAATTSWRDVRRVLGPEAEERMAARRGEMEAEMIAHGLAELREHRRGTLAQLATTLAITPGSLSRREHSTDPLLSTIRAQVEALGGHLQLVADFDCEKVALDLLT